MMKIGTSGFRGIIAADFTFDAVSKIAKETCDIIKKHRFKKEVFVGYDNRFLSDSFAKHFAKVLVANDIKIIMAGASVPCPLASFAGKFLGNDITIFISASHNPYYYNGIKIFSKDGRDLEHYLEAEFNAFSDHEKKIKMMELDVTKENGLFEIMPSLYGEYIDNMLKNVKFSHEMKELKTAFNCMHGSSVKVVEMLVDKKKLNCDILNTNRDVEFEGSAPIPNEDKLVDFAKKVESEGYAFGFATDGDGDRIGVIDEKGNYYNGNLIAPMLYYYAVKAKGISGGFVGNYVFSSLGKLVCDILHTDYFETKVGFKNIGEALINNNAYMGAEENGIEIGSNVYTKDGIMTYLLLLEMVANLKKPLSEIVKDFKKHVGYNMTCYADAVMVNNRKRVETALEKFIPNFGISVESTGNLDGHKYFFEDGSWLLLRFSGTEPYMRIMGEFKNKKDMQMVTSRAKDFVTSL
jgi:phosphomannomutase